MIYVRTGRMVSMLKRPENGLSRRLHTQNDKKRNKMKKTLFFIKYLNYRMCISKGIFPANKEPDHE
jgi:hypothetical protein